MLQEASQVIINFNFQEASHDQVSVWDAILFITLLTLGVASLL